MDELNILTVDFAGKGKDRSRYVNDDEQLHSSAQQNTIGKTKVYCSREGGTDGEAGRTGQGQNI